MTEFVNQRLQQAEKHLFDPIKKGRLKSFGNLNKVVRAKHSNKTLGINIDRQLFSQLAVIGQSMDLDLRDLMQYELAPVPVSLFHLDVRCEILSWMEKDLATRRLPPSDQPTLLIIDLMMLVRMVCTDTAQCSSFGDLADQLLSTILGMKYQYTAVVGDNYNNQESIKSGERARRGAVQMHELRNITSITPLPVQRTKMLSNPQNKTNTANYLLNTWISRCEEQL